MVLISLGSNFCEYDLTGENSVNMEPIDSVQEKLWS